ncbi:Eukaryotic initiation factor 4A-III [Actinomortierella ambigua]|nr:Eukaryotic initiation factor 4A-III [Actinomortierella ambigua]
MSHPTLAELSLALSHVQSLLSDLTAEVKVITTGIAHLVNEEKATKEQTREDDGDDELDYLDVDPWSNVNEQERASAFVSDYDEDDDRGEGEEDDDRKRSVTTTGSVVSAAMARNNTGKKTRKDSVRSLLQRRPSTVKDETKALARILSQKGGSSLRQSTTPSVESQDRSQQQPTPSSSPDVVSTSYEGGAITGSGGMGVTTNGNTATPLDQRHDYNNNDSPEGEAIPHTITVQTRNVQKYALAFTKPTTPQSATAPSLSTLASQPLPSISGGGSGPTTPNAGSSANPPPFWRSSTMPNAATEGSGSRPHSAGSNHSAFEGSGRQSVNSTHASRRSIDARTLTSDHYSFVSNGTSQERRSGSNPVLHPGVGKDPVHQTFRPPQSSSATHVERVDSVDCFSKLALSPELLRGIYAYGLKVPTFLQQRGIPMIMTRQDVLAQTKPEIAKTVTYAIPLLHFLTLPATSIHPQLIILCSNNDLCLHVQRVLLALARFMPTISCLICAEGDNATISHGTISTTQVKLQQQDQQQHNRASMNGSYTHNKRHSATGAFIPTTEYLPPIAAHVVIGTPSKVLHMLRTRQISTKALKVLLLENADVLLLAPFKEATIALMSMIREAPNPGTNGYPTVGRMGTSASGGMASPPNSGPTSPVSMAVAALNSRIMSANGGSATPPGGAGAGVGTGGDINSRSTSPLKSSQQQQQPQPQQVQYIFLSTDVPSYVLDYHDDMDIIAKKNALGVFRQTAPPTYLVTTDALVKDLEILGVPLVVSYEVPAISNYISRVKWIDRTGGRIGIKVTLVDGQRGEAGALRAIQQHYRTPIDDMPATIADLIIN